MTRFTAKQDKFLKLVDEGGLRHLYTSVAKRTDTLVAEDVAGRRQADNSCAAPDRIM